jgi:KUP system potassium uptake protein
LKRASSRKSSRRALTLAALGIVFGDIGTSPLYAVKETFSPDHGIALTADNILGGVSTIFWALMIVVSLKYVLLIMRADNRGEGGIMALIALAQSAVRDQPHWRLPLMLIGIFGASLFYGDAVLTPAISVLSAVEGLHVGTTIFDPYVVPIAVGVLLALFAFQSRGTAAVGRLFGPVTMLWFFAIGAAGIHGIVRAPAILAALNPLHAFSFLTSHGMASFVVLGAVVLAVTGAEALYADMGHFGKDAVRIGWFSLVAPAPVQLGFLPRINVVHTSAREIGQIYIPTINWLLCAVVVAAVIGFGSSSRLAGAYGVAVTATMMVDTLLTFFVIRYAWRYPLWLCVLATGFFLVIDVTFFSATLLKIADGGWFPLAIGACVFSIMTTWRRGREHLFGRLRASSVPLEEFLKSLFLDPPQRVPGTAVFLTATPEATPHALLHNLNHNKVLHERVVFLTVDIHEEPWISNKERVVCQKLGHGCWRVRVSYGFLERPDITKALGLCAGAGLPMEMMETSFFLSRELIAAAEGGAGMARWRDRMFAAMARNAGSVTDFFNIPPNRVIELGTRIEI